MLTVRQVATKLEVHPETVRTWLREGKLKGIKIGARLWRIPEEALDEFLKSPDKH